MELTYYNTGCYKNDGALAKTYAGIFLFKSTMLNIYIIFSFPSIQSHIKRNN